jgi:hypothetical protein
LGQSRERQGFRIRAIAGVRGTGIHKVGCAGAAAPGLTATLPVDSLPRAPHLLSGHICEAGPGSNFVWSFSRAVEGAGYDIDKLWS